MLKSAPPAAASQQSRLRQFGCARSVDIHCHVLGGVDDGPRGVNESLALCRALIQDGFTDIIATPHQLGRWDGTNLAPQVRAAVVELQSRLDETNLPLRIHPGGEVRLDERIPQLLGSGKVLTLADQGVYLLLELPRGLVIDPARLLPFLTAAGTRVVLAHAERYDTLVADPSVAEAWVRQGAAFQVNATSLLEQNQQADAAWDWLARGWVSLVASDSHSVNTRRPRMTETIEQIVSRLGADAAKRVCIENPARILDGRELI